MSLCVTLVDLVFWDEQTILRYVSSSSHVVGRPPCSKCNGLAPKFTRSMPTCAVSALVVSSEPPIRLENWKMPDQVLDKLFLVSWVFSCHGHPTKIIRKKFNSPIQQRWVESSWFFGLLHLAVCNTRHEWQPHLETIWSNVPCKKNSNHWTFLNHPVEKRVGDWLTFHYLAFVVTNLLSLLHPIWLRLPVTSKRGRSRTNLRLL